MRQAYSVVTPVAVCSVSVSASSAICIGNETEDIFLMLYNSRFEIAGVWFEVTDLIDALLRYPRKEATRRRSSQYRNLTLKKRARCASVLKHLPPSLS